MDMDFALFQQVVNHTAEDKNVSARFYDKAVKTAEINDAGLPIFANKTYVEIRIKDNCTEVFNQPATAEKIKRFPREYEIYQLSKKQTAEGTPLEQFAFLTAAEIATCKNRGIFTVEALANLDFAKVKCLGLENEHISAQMFLEKSENNKEIRDFIKKEDEYKNQIKSLQERIEILEAQLTSVSKNSKPKNKKSKGVKK